MQKNSKISRLIVLIAAAITGIALLGYHLRPVDINSKATELEAYCRSKGYNADYGILVDYGRNSLQKRLFVYDFNNDKVVMSSLAGHGSGGNSTFFRADFSNAGGSHCSSLGHYRIGRERRMYNRPIMAFELDGLDRTNSNARPRGILIHAGVGPLSWGCISLPFTRYEQLSGILEGLPKNVIVWAYD